MTEEKTTAYTIISSRQYSLTLWPWKQRIWANAHKTCDSL